MNFKFPAEYYTSMQLIMFDKQDNASLTYVFDKVYPVVVSGSPVSWNSTEISKLDVSFMYSNWRIIKTNPSKLSIGINTPIGGGTITF